MFSTPRAGKQTCFPALGRENRLCLSLKYEDLDFCNERKFSIYAENIFSDFSVSIFEIIQKIQTKSGNTDFNFRKSGNSVIVNKNQRQQNIFGRGQ